MGIANRLGSWAATRGARRLTRSLPIVGTVVAVAVVGRTIRRKGWRLGLLDAALDAMPFIGTAKAGAELVRGDFFPDRPLATPAEDPTSRRPK